MTVPLDRKATLLDNTEPVERVVTGDHQVRTGFHRGALFARGQR
jgi:hypothetical protein